MVGIIRMRPILSHKLSDKSVLVFINVVVLCYEMKVDELQWVHHLP